MLGQQLVPAGLAQVGGEEDLPHGDAPALEPPDAHLHGGGAQGLLLHVRNTNTWRPNKLFLNNQRVTEEIRRKTEKFLETNDNENTTQILWDAVKAVLREKFMAIQSYLKKQ